MDGIEVYQGKTLENLCRSCLKILSKDDALDISSPELFHKTKIFFPVDVEEAEKFPNNMCKDCYDKMEEFYSFYELCQQSTRKCLEMLQENIIKYEMEIIKEEEDLAESVTFSDRSLNLESDYELDDDDQDSENGDIDFDPLIPGPDDEDIKPTQKKAVRNKSSGEVYNCEKCDKRFFKEFRFRAHMRVHEGLKGYECPMCQKTFAKASTQAAHIRDVHEEPGATHQCPYPGCDKVYSRQQTLKWHQKSVHEKGESAENKDHPLIICEECGKTFKNMNSLKKHR